MKNPPAIPGLRSLAIPRGEDVQEKMWVEIIQHMEGLYAELVESHTKLERQKEELERTNEELRRIQDHLIQSEKMRSLGRMAAGVAHELNNPLGGILIYTHLIDEDTPPEDPRKANLGKIVAEAERCRRIVRDLLGFARPPVAVTAVLDLRAVLQQTLSVLGQSLFHNVQVERNVQDPLPGVRGDSGQIQQALTNIILNAVQAMDGKGTLRIDVGSARASGREEVTAAVSDTGCGIARENLKKLFEPFFTTKAPGKGTGLGLFVTCGIIECHGGRVEVESEVGKGSTFRIVLPAAERSHEAR